MIRDLVPLLLEELHPVFQRDLSAPPGESDGGRHPLPTAEDFARAAGAAGIGPGVFVIAYDQGMTSGPTKAILAAVVGRPYRIAFGGRTVLQYAEDVARTLIAASRSSLTGARVFNLGGSLVGMDELVAAIEAAVPGARGLITYDPEPLPFPDSIDDSGLEVVGDVPVTPLDEAVRRTATVFRDRLTRGLLDPESHGLEAVVAGS